MGQLAWMWINCEVHRDGHQSILLLFANYVCKAQVMYERWYDPYRSLERNLFSWARSCFSWITSESCLVQFSRWIIPTSYQWWIDWVEPSSSVQNILEFLLWWGRFSTHIAVQSARLHSHCLRIQWSNIPLHWSKARDWSAPRRWGFEAAVLFAEATLHFHQLSRQDIRRGKHERVYAVTHSAAQL